MTMNALPILLLGGAALMMMGGKKKVTGNGSAPVWKFDIDGPFFGETGGPSSWFTVAIQDPDGAIYPLGFGTPGKAARYFVGETPGVEAWDTAAASARKYITEQGGRPVKADLPSAG